jgi:hydroxyacylglutathione hydrolase
VEFNEMMENGAVVLDTRSPLAFAGAHIKGSYNVWLSGIPAWSGWILEYGQPVLLVLENRLELETAVRYLIRIGFDNIAGYLCSGVYGCGIESWYNLALPIEKVGLLTVHELKDRLENDGEIFILDVRRENEWETGHVKNALHIYLGFLKDNLTEIPQDKPVAVYCKSGHRANLGASILKANGFQNVYSVLGSMTAWENAGYDIIK